MGKNEENEWYKFRDQYRIRYFLKVSIMECMDRGQLYRTGYGTWNGILGGNPDSVYTEIAIRVGVGSGMFGGGVKDFLVEESNTKHIPSSVSQASFR